MVRLSVEQLRSADTLLFGRYQGMAAYWPSQQGEVASLMNNIDEIVFSKTLEKSDWSNTRVVRERAADEVSKLK